MQRVVLERLETGDQGTFGRLLAGEASFFTGELPDRGNAPNVSCIPAGVYPCVWTWSPAFKRMMYLVDRVPGRSGIRIHAANFMGDKSKGYRSHLNGCIALGLRLGVMNGQKAVLLSQPAIADFELAMDGRPFELEVVQ